MMSSGSYQPPPIPLASSFIQSRRTSGGLPLSDLRVLSLRRSPSPGPSRRYGSFDDYVAPRSAGVYREGYSSYGQNSYRPESHLYFSRSPSPDRRYESSRDLDTDNWERSIPWQSANKTTTWPDRRATTLSPTSSVISRERVRSDPTVMPRMFEPSDAWKQTQVDRSNPAQSPKSSPVERQGMRDFRDHSLERPVRIHATSYVAHSDRYRPDQTGRGRRSKSYRRRRQTGSSYRPTLVLMTTTTRDLLGGLVRMGLCQVLDPGGLGRLPARAHVRSHVHVHALLLRSLDSNLRQYQFLDAVLIAASDRVLAIRTGWVADVPSRALPLDHPLLLHTCPTILHHVLFPQ
ncbi:hypothetical protein B0H10DRAFT_1356933 [Mycena sp. CBHHK59/15]|nr:hypothetical protein B0H10DRAFT_1356933 [Mycena sp. CBHHK59/15]